MTTRAFRFFEPGGLATAGAGDGLGGAPAGLVVTTTGAVSMVDGDAAVRQALLVLLSTTPGERLMRPGYGSYLRRLLFAPNDETTAGLAIHYVRQAVRRWEPRVDIVHLDARADPDDASRLTIELRYQVRASLVTDTLDLSISLHPTPAGSEPVAGL
jgi:phage baseplate assembly protein W